MRMQFDSLKYAKLMRKKGTTRELAEDLMSMLTQIELLNLYSKQEVDSMLSTTIEKVFTKQDEKLAEQRREFDARMKDMSHYHEQQLRDNKLKLLASRRWLIGTIITVGLSLATLILYHH